MATEELGKRQCRLVSRRPEPTGDRYHKTLNGYSPRKRSCDSPHRYGNGRPCSDANGNYEGQLKDFKDTDNNTFAIILNIQYVLNG
ncbi:MAG: hypothetical protein ACXW1Z_06540 [Methylobacter sp.]